MTLEEYKAQYSDSINMFALDQIIAKLYRASNFIGSENDKWIRRHIEQNQEEYDRQSKEWEKQYLRMKNDKNTAMKDNNLDAAPTEQELGNAGFRRETHDKDGYQFTYTKILCGDIEVKVLFNYNKIHSYLFLVGRYLVKNVEPTKAAINKEFRHFGQPLPQWNKPRPKVGEVYSSVDNTFFVQKIRDSHATCVNLAPHHVEFGANITSFDGYKKEADSLEQYYKEKQLKQYRDKFAKLD